MNRNKAGKTNRDKPTLKSLLASITFILLLASCINAKKSPTQQTTQHSAESTPNATRIVPTRTPTSTSIIPTETPTPTSNWYSEAMYKYTQGPAAVTTNEEENDIYIYKYAYVTFIIPFRDESMVRLNLDNLDDNGYKNSDVVIDHATGTGGTFIDLYPINGATYYFSDLHSMSYESCLEHFPFINMDPKMYASQSAMIGSQRDYCVLTEDGHLSIMRYVQDTYLPDDWDHVKLELVVTTYKQIVPQALTLWPTNTPGPSPTPYRYTGMNLTNKQELSIDNAAQAFLDAVTTNNREKLADLMEYPLMLDYEGYDYLDYANNRDEFLAAYDGMFTHDLVEDFKFASLNENLGIHFGNSLSFLVKNGMIGFRPNGKIYKISNSSIWWELENK